MDDIVEHLRWLESHGNETPHYWGQAADEIERLREALRQGVAMRAAQKAYFADRSRENLIASKEAERAFDIAARAALKEDKPFEDRWDNA
jgi:hypothetical protein